ncbi:MAG TPA: aminoacetone oxidase family FAD-binding enzyme [Bacteroidales bacterium]|nr:aminoacetone oxidase family FAD-binding enzyme [Bacteroidales bacterium]
MNVAIIGGGAAGFFAAISVKENHKNAKVTIYEKANKVLAKVKVTGGGRCNYTNNCPNISELVKAYPRGGKSLKKIFSIFGTQDTLNWFAQRGVKATIQPDNCVFPKTQSSQSIIDCLVNEAKRLGVYIETECDVKAIKQINGQLELSLFSNKHLTKIYDKVIVTIGGQPKRDGLNWLETLGHKIESPVPSLFTFNMPNEPITKLMGIVVENTEVGIQGTKLKSNGPLLITHWGMSGPAILKLSSYGARVLSEQSYKCKVQVNWANEPNFDLVTIELQKIIKEHPNKLLANKRAYNLQERLWLFLMEKCELSDDKKWSEIGKKGLNKLANILCNDQYAVEGKTTFRDEFVTCGGVSLESVDLNTLQSKTCKNLYFAGEVLDIDAITGGYNLQAAWSTGFIAGKLNE